MMRTAVVVATFTAGLLCIAPHAVAEEVSDLSVRAQVSPDASMTVTETIDYDFTGTVRHGIYRDIPAYDVLVSGEQRHYGVAVASVLMDGQPVPFETGAEGSYLRVRIGDPDTFVTGVHEYFVEYRVTGALRALTSNEAAAIGGQAGDVELYWNFVGGGWEVPVAKADARLTGPAEVLAVGCFAGSYGSDKSCATAVSGANVDYGPVRLPVGASLTGAAAWPAAAFSAPVVQDIRPGPGAAAGRGAMIGGATGVLVMVAMIGSAIAMRRRERGADMSVAPPMYGPPCGLAPAEMVAARDGIGSSSVSLMATILDLAARGWLRIADMGDERVGLSRLEAGSGELRAWEARLMEAAFGNRSTVTLGDYDPGLTVTWTGIGIRLVDEAEAAGFRNPAGGRPDRRWVWVGVAGAIVAAASAVWLVVGGAAFVPAVGAVLGGCVVVGAIAATVITPRTETATSARFQAELAGLVKVLGTDPAAGRQVYAQGTGLAPAAIMTTMLPYAVALGLESAWVSAFPDLTGDDLSGFGFDVMGAQLLSALVMSAAQSSSGAVTEPPSSSPSSRSSGSGLSGDGYAGGGGGGGGGGSW